MFVGSTGDHRLLFFTLLSPSSASSNFSKTHRLSDKYSPTTQPRDRSGAKAKKGRGKAVGVAGEAGGREDGLRPQQSSPSPDVEVSAPLSSLLSFAAAVANDVGGDAFWPSNTLLRYPIKSKLEAPAAVSLMRRGHSVGRCIICDAHCGELVTEAKAPVATFTPIHVPPLGMLVSMAHSKWALWGGTTAAAKKDAVLGDGADEVGSDADGMSPPPPLAAVVVVAVGAFDMGVPAAPKSFSWEVDRPTYSSLLLRMMIGKRREAPVAMVRRHIDVG